MLKQNKKLGGLSMITNYIKENYKADLSLESLAEIFGYSPAYLSKMLKRYAGINYKAYLQNVRLEHAYQYNNRKPRSSRPNNRPIRGCFLSFLIAFSSVLTWRHPIFPLKCSCKSLTACKSMLHSNTAYRLL